MKKSEINISGWHDRIMDSQNLLYQKEDKIE